MAGSLLNQLKQEAKSRGTSQSKVFWVGDGNTRRVRFLTPFESAEYVPMLTRWGDDPVKCINPEYFGQKNPYKDDETVKEETWYLWQVYDYEMNAVSPFFFKQSRCTPVDQLTKRCEQYGDIIDRDYNIEREGSGTDTRYTVLPLAKSKFRQEKIKPLTKKAIMKILSDAYPLPEKPTEPADLSMGGTEEIDFDELSKGELYDLCIERGITCKSGEVRGYYIDLLEDNATYYTDDTDDEWGDEEEDSFDIDAASARECYERLVNVYGLKPPKGKPKALYVKKLHELEPEEPEDEWDDIQGPEDEWDDMGLPFN